MTTPKSRVLLCPRHKSRFPNLVSTNLISLSLSLVELALIDDDEDSDLISTQSLRQLIPQYYREGLRSLGKKVVLDGDGDDIPIYTVIVSELSGFLDNACYVDFHNVILADLDFAFKYLQLNVYEKEKEVDKQKLIFHINPLDMLHVSIHHSTESQVSGQNAKNVIARPGVNAGEIDGNELSNRVPIVYDAFAGSTDIATDMVGDQSTDIDNIGATKNLEVVQAFNEPTERNKKETNKETTD